MATGMLHDCCAQLAFYYTLCGLALRPSLTKHQPQTCLPCRYAEQAHIHRYLASLGCATLKKKPVLYI